MPNLKGPLFAAIFAIFYLFAPIAARAATCDAGYYLENGECAICGHNHYCPGDDMRYSCPDPTGRLMSDWPENYHNPVIANHSFYIENNLSYQTMRTVTSCKVYYFLDSEYGHLYDIRTYNPTTDLYESNRINSWGWMASYPGYYLLNPKACYAAAYYSTAEICPPGAYCPGEVRHTCGNGYIQPETFGLYVCGDNTYSNAGAAECTPCPMGTGNSGDNIADHAGVESCVSLPLCTAGAKRLHAGNIFFNIWPNDKCTSPALRIGLPGGVCCVNLAPGHGNRAININYNGQIYHTVN